MAQSGSIPSYVHFSVVHNCHMASQFFEVGHGQPLLLRSKLGAPSSIAAGFHGVGKRRARVESHVPSQRLGVAATQYDYNIVLASSPGSLRVAGEPGTFSHVV